VSIQVPEVVKPLLDLALLFVGHGRDVGRRRGGHLPGRRACHGPRGRVARQYLRQDAAVGIVLFAAADQANYGLSYSKWL